MNQRAILNRMTAITAERKTTDRTVTFKTPADTEWQTASFATSQRAEYFKARVLHQGGEIQ